MAYVIVILVLLGLCLLLTIDNSWMNVLQAMRNNIVFANHNKEYGAYELRRDYNRRLGTSLLLAIGVFVVAVGAPFVVNKFAAEVKEEKKKKIVEVNLDLFEEQPEEPPPPPEIIPPEPPKIETVQFVAVEAADEPVEEPPPTQKEMEVTTAGQTTQEGVKDDVPPPAPVEEITYDIAQVEEQPMFPGGMQKMYDYLGANTNYPEMQQEAGIQGKVWVEFTVEADGSVQDVKVKKSLDPVLDKEALKAIRSMPRWSPGKMGGRSVKCRFSIPVAFKMQ